MSEAPATLKMFLDLVVEAEDEPREEDCEDDTVPGLDVPDDNLAVVEDFILQLPAGPPAADDESVEDGVGEGSVQHRTMTFLPSLGSLVAVGGEDVADSVEDDDDRAAGCRAEGFEGNQRSGGEKEDSEQLVPGLGGEQRVQNVETSDPHDHRKQRVNVDDDHLDQSLR